MENKVNWRLHNKELELLNYINRVATDEQIYKEHITAEQIRILRKLVDEIEMVSKEEVK